jgi:hypothetical protein
VVAKRKPAIRLLSAISAASIRKKVDQKSPIEKVIVKYLPSKKCEDLTISSVSEVTNG